MPVPALIVAGTHSGSGKTTATLALLAALSRRGLRVQGFKVGPDFIDPGHQTRLTGRPSRNLDTWLLDPDALARTYRRGVAGADLALIEGAMGLFDGRGALDEAGSAADLARRWGLPVVLVVDAAGMARSLAPLVRGFARFDPTVRVAGVIANRTGSRRHFDEYLAPALRSAGDAEPLGAIERDETVAIPSRHLGLWTADEFRPGSGFADALADVVERGVDLDRLVELARVPNLPAELDSVPRPARRIRVAVARDAAFCFYYEDNLDALRDAGAELHFFSPLEDSCLPPDIRLLYLGGGYPEVFAERLASNASMRIAIRQYHADGGAILAECGGMMACCRLLRAVEGREWPLWDLIPARAVMQSRFAALGYVTIVTEAPTLLGPVGTEVRGHEFHYSRLEPLTPLLYSTHLIRPDRPPKPDAVAIGGLLAGYAHLHFGSNPAVATSLINTC